MFSTFTCLGFALLTLNFALPTVGTGSVISITQSDFEDGSYIISEPGYYQLAEHIVFRPLFKESDLGDAAPELTMYPVEDQEKGTGKYSARAFSLGFFAAIVIQAEDVVLDLNGKNLSQSSIHAATQRFFALIELSSAPFPPRNGPANFGTSQFIPSRNVTIENGNLGLSSHHGIHGNLNQDITLRNLVISNFEVAGISLNQVSDLKVESVDIMDSRRDVPISGRLSQAIFGLQALSVHLNLNSKALSSETSELLMAQSALRKSVSTVLKQIYSGENVDNKLFATLTEGLPDGSFVGGILINPKVFVGDKLVTDELNSSAVDIKDVSVKRLSISPIEQSTLMLEGGSIGGYGSGHIQDMIGAVFDLDSCYSLENGEYVPNDLADFQIAMARYGHACLENVKACGASSGEIALMRRNTITEAIISWSEGLMSGEDMTELYSFQPNRDYMFHTNKGAIGLKLSGTRGMTVDNLEVSHLENHASESQRGYHVRNNLDYTGFQVKGISMSSSVNIVGRLEVNRLWSLVPNQIFCVDYLNNVNSSGVSIDSLQGFTTSSSLPGLLPKVNPLLTYRVQEDTCEASEGWKAFGIASLVMLLLVVTVVLLLQCRLWNRRKSTGKVMRQKKSSSPIGESFTQDIRLS
mmetsp:Transcript_7247/g.8781  ORF Transcript_7247/g.8781 Transcript_7247/m.8781 type:complete len:638 (+) Transcript_7247:170-2083(+)